MAAVKPTAIVTVVSVLADGVLVRFPGSSVPVTAKNYAALVLSPGQKVTVQLGPAPTPPIITAALSAAPPDTGGARVVNIETPVMSAGVIFDIGDVLTANNAGSLFAPTGWAIGDGDPAVYTVDDSGITVDFASFTGGSAAVLTVLLEASSVTTDKYVDLHASNSGLFTSLTAPVFPGALAALSDAAFCTLLPLSASSGEPALPLAFNLIVSDLTATASGPCELIVILSLLVPGSSYVDPEA